MGSDNGNSLSKPRFRAAAPLALRPELAIEGVQRPSDLDEVPLRLLPCLGDGPAGVQDLADHLLILWQVGPGKHLVDRVHQVARDVLQPGNLSRAQVGCLDLVGIQCP